MAGQHPKDLRDYIPVLADQGIKNVVACPVPGVGIQIASFTMLSGPDDFVFADNGLEDMENASYEVVPINQTDASDQSIISAKTTKQFTITGADTNDVQTLLIIGQLKGQLA